MHKLIYELLFSQRHLAGVIPADLLMNKSDQKKNYLHYKPCLLLGVEKSYAI